MGYDQITQDLCRKAADDVDAVIQRTAALLDGPAEQMMLAMFAASATVGAATGFTAALVEKKAGEKPEPSVVADQLWAMLRPMVLSAAGDDRMFKNFLARITEGNPQ